MVYGNLVGLIKQTKKMMKMINLSPQSPVKPKC